MYLYLSLGLAEAPDGLDQRPHAGDRVHDRELQVGQAEADRRGALVQHEEHDSVPHSSPGGEQHEVDRRQSEAVFHRQKPNANKASNEARISVERVPAEALAKRCGV